MCDQRPIWTSGEHGYNTYRIPSLLTTSSGTVLAFCEGRVSDPGDQGAIAQGLVRAQHDDPGVEVEDADAGLVDAVAQHALAIRGPLQRAGDVRELLRAGEFTEGFSENNDFTRRKI